MRLALAGFLSAFRKKQLVRLKDPVIFRANRSSRKSSPGLRLEDQIHLLRMNMEEIFLKEQSLTSTSVIEASSLLDDKINEYMQSVRGR